MSTQQCVSQAPFLPALTVLWAVSLAFVCLTVANDALVFCALTEFFMLTVVLSLFFGHHCSTVISLVLLF